MPFCSRVRRQVLHFHVLCKTWSIFQHLSSIFSFRNVAKANTCSKKQTKNKDYVEIFLLLADVFVLDCYTSTTPCPSHKNFLVYLMTQIRYCLSRVLHYIGAQSGYLAHAWYHPRSLKIWLLNKAQSTGHRSRAVLVLRARDPHCLAA